VQAICARAGVGRTSFYNYFDDATVLVAEIANHAGQEIRSAFDLLHDAQPRGHDRLSDCLAMILTIARDDPAHAQVLTALAQAERTLPDLMLSEITAELSGAGLPDAFIATAAPFVTTATLALTQSIAVGQLPAVDIPAYTRMLLAACCWRLVFRDSHLHCRGIRHSCIMDGIHDLGGKEGYGPVPVTAGDAPFIHEWEPRMWGLAREGICPTMTIDWFRHGLELMVPGDYLTYSYFQKWATNYLMLMVDSGQFTLEEVQRGYVLEPKPPAPPKTVADIVAQVRAACTDFSAPEDAPARFAIGDTVRTLRQIPHAHTRLPAYARDAAGQVIAHHGCHLLPDEGAQNRHIGQHLYTISFSACELWGADANPRDTVTLELWESYLTPA